MFLRLLEIGLFCLAFYAIIVQVLVPIIKGTVLFPMFRKKQTELEQELVELNQEAVEAALQQKIDEVKQQQEGNK